MYELKVLNTINWKVLSVQLLLKLFRALIEPILLYGCQIILPTALPKQIVGLVPPNTTTYFINHGNVNIEKPHLRFLKWILGIHKKATNVFCWQEAGELPLVYKALDLSIKYLNRLEQLDTNNLAQQALIVQKKLNLNRYNVLRKGIKDTSNLLKLKQQFIGMTTTYCKSHSKMEVVTKTNTKFGLQLYLQYVKDFNTRQCISKLRGSCHCLEIEIGRYNNKPREERVCISCSEAGTVVVEDEAHLLGSCVLTAKVRTDYGIEDDSDLILMLAESTSAIEHHRLGTSIQAMYALKQDAKHYQNKTTKNRI